MPTKLARSFLVRLTATIGPFTILPKGTDEEIYAEFRRVRDQIQLVFEAYAAGLREGQTEAQRPSQPDPVVEKPPGRSLQSRKVNSNEYDQC